MGYNFVADIDIIRLATVGSQNREITRNSVKI